MAAAYLTMGGIRQLSRDEFSAWELRETNRATVRQGAVHLPSRNAALPACRAASASRMAFPSGSAAAAIKPPIASSNWVLVSPE